MNDVLCVSTNDKDLWIETIFQPSLREDQQLGSTNQSWMSARGSSPQQPKPSLRPLERGHTPSALFKENV